MATLLDEGDAELLDEGGEALTDEAGSDVVTVTTEPTFTFEPPTILGSPITYRGARGFPLFQHYDPYLEGQTVLNENGVYTTVPSPPADRLNAATVGYQGGHVYTVSESEAAGLTLAGYTVGGYVGLAQKSAAFTATASTWTTADVGRTVTAGNLLVAGFKFSTPVANVPIPSGWQAIQQNFQSPTRSTHLFYKEADGETAITVTVTGGDVAGGGCFAEYAGLTSPTLDDSAVIAPGSAQSSFTVGPADVSTVHGLAVVLLGISGGNWTGTWFDGYTTAVETNAFFSTGYKQMTEIGTATATHSVNTSVGGAGIIATFRDG